MSSEQTRLPAFDPASVRRLVVLLVVAATVATAGCSGALPGGDDGPSDGADDRDPVEYVPADQDVLIHVDMAILQDQTTRDLFNELGEEEVEQDSVEEAFSDFEDETGLDPTSVDEVLVFSASGGSGLDADPSAEDDVGIVFHSDWGEDELVSAIEEDGTTDLEVRSHQGREVLYEPVETPPGEDPTYLGVLGDGTFVIGTEAAVTDSLDVQYGDADAVSGPLLDAYEDAPDGLVTFAMVVPQDELGTGTGGGEFGSSAAEDLEAVNGVYTTEGDQVRFETRLLISSEESATEVQQMVQGLVALYQQDPELAEVVQHVSVEQDGSTVVVSFEASVDELAELSETSP